MMVLIKLSVKAPAVASTCALLLALVLPVTAGAQSGEERLGTLFFSPAERSAVMAMRRGEQQGVINFGTTVSVSGLVKRGGQKSTALIKGHTGAEGQAVPSAC